MIAGKKALVGFLALGAGAAAQGWMLLPKKSKLRKLIAGKTNEMGEVLKNHIDDVVNVTNGKKPQATSAK